ncbi:Fc.00g022760.m01.CDS01 [Cosmosporella sp. VM-42]
MERTETTGRTTLLSSSSSGSQEKNDPHYDIEAMPMTESPNSTANTVGSPAAKASVEYFEGNFATVQERARDAFTALGGFLAVTATFGLLAAAGLLRDSLHKHQLKEYTSTQVGWILRMQAGLAFWIPWAGGLMYDRFSHRPLLLLGTSTFMLGIFLAAIVDKTMAAGYRILFWFYGVFSGTGIGLIVSAVTGIICTNFQGRCGFVAGLVFNGASMGGIMWALILRAVLEQRGWAEAIHVVGGVATAMLVVGVAMLWGSRKNRRTSLNRKSFISTIQKFKQLLRCDYATMTIGLAI